MDVAAQASAGLHRAIASSMAVTAIHSSLLPALPSARAENSSPVRVWDECASIDNDAGELPFAHEGPSPAVDTGPHEITTLGLGGRCIQRSRYTLCPWFAEPVDGLSILKHFRVEGCSLCSDSSARHSLCLHWRLVHNQYLQYRGAILY